MIFDGYVCKKFIRGICLKLTKSNHFDFGWLQAKTIFLPARCWMTVAMIFCFLIKSKILQVTERSGREKWINVATFSLHTVETEIILLFQGLQEKGYNISAENIIMLKVSFSLYNYYILWPLWKQGHLHFSSETCSARSFGWWVKKFLIYKIQPHEKEY